MLTTSTYDPAIHGAPHCDGCGLPHLLLGGAVYTLPTPTRRLLTIAQSCVFVESVRLTRTVCSALSSDDFALLLATMCEPDEVSAASAAMCEALDAVAEVRPTTCGLCGTRLTGTRETTDDICDFCAAALRGW